MAPSTKRHRQADKHSWWSTAPERSIHALLTAVTLFFDVTMMRSQCARRFAKAIMALHAINRSYEASLGSLEHIICPIK